MGLLEKFLPKNDRYAAMLLYGMVLATCFNGYDAGIMTVILADDQFTEYYHVDADRQGTIAAVPWATTGLAQLFVGGTLAGFVGRLWALRISIVVMMVGIVVQCVPNTYGVLILGRLITGLGFGCVYIATSLYVAECSPRLLRGSFVGTVTQFGYQLGTLVAFWAGYGMSFVDSPYNVAWRVSNLLQLPIGVTFLVLSFWYPESPRWLLEKQPDNPERVLKVLCKLRMGDENSDHVLAEYHELVAAQKARARYDTGYKGIFKSKGMRKRLLYGLYATALQQAGGIAALTMYAALIYESLGWNQGSQALSINGIQAALQLVMVLVNTFTVDKFGRRALLLAGFAIQATALLILSALTTAFPENSNRAAAVVEVAMLFIVGLTYCWSNGPIPPAIASEIFPQEPWPRFNKQVGGKSYWLLFCLNTVLLISVYFILPETKGISLERMDRLFGEVDAVEAGEQGRGLEKAEALARSFVEHRVADEKGAEEVHASSERIE
ncbi:MFS sugar transporter-like protein [Stemphylium lycopersici]|nr:ascus development protein [Stemphylium lycopersici]RAR01339.1 MFS sugar transporter-like protein [Stemphylium lycopersici]